MSHPEELSRWIDRLASHLTGFSAPQIRALALWSFAMAVCRCCGLDCLTVFLSVLLGQKENTVRERLRDLYRPAERKRGQQRCELDVSRAAADLLAWCAGGAKRLVLALDVTNVGSRFHILTISVVCRGGAVPLVWRILKGNQPGEWTPHWKELLSRLAGVLAEDVTVLVPTDRGVESRRLYAAIREVGFHPLMRLKQGSATFRPAGWTQFYPLQKFAQLRHYSAKGELYKSGPLPCNLLICHDEGHEEAWILATDLESAQPAWYAFRSWIEQGFKDIKRGGFNWQRTRIEDPVRLERVWLAMALAMLWILEVGAQAEALALGSLQSPTTRRYSLMLRGLMVILATLIYRRGTLVTESMIFNPPPLPEDPWPTDLSMPPTITEHDFQNFQKTYT